MKPPPIDTLYTIPYTLSLYVWLAIFGSIIALFLASLCIGYDKSEVFFSSVKVAFLPIVSESLVINEMQYRETKAKAILLTIWMLCGALIIYAFQSNLLASFAVVRHGPPINTLEDVIESGKRVSLGKSSLAGRLLAKEEENALLKTIYTNQILNEKVMIIITQRVKNM